MGLNTGNGHNEHDSTINNNNDRDSLLRVFGDDDLIQKVFPSNNIKIIFSEDFMRKSKDFYNALPWLGRELIQNFIDANPHARGTLNGVDIQFNKGSLENKISIKGNWGFEKPTALYKLDSGKANDANMAGGNGIGLKQTVLILFRDYGIKDFVIRGKNRSLRYSFLSAEHINQLLKQQEISGRVSKGRLIAEITPEADRSFTEYEIVVNSKNDKVFDGLQNMKQYGVYDANPYLQNMEYKFGGAGSIKLLPNTDTMGALFLNGQRFRCKLDRNQSITKNVGEKFNSSIFSAEELYWGGPGGMTLCVNTEYQMSIDRQPIGSHEIKNYTAWFLDNMKLDDVIDLFVKTAPTWKALITRSGSITKYSYYSWSDDTPLIEHFIYQIVDVLQSHLYVVNEFDSIFEHRIGKRATLVACDIDNPEELRKLSRKGYTLVPEYFKSLGIQGASLLVEHTKRVLSAEDIQRLHEEQAMETGVSVPYREFEEKGLENERLFYGYLSNNLGKATTAYSHEAKKLSIEFTDVGIHSLDMKHLYGIQTASIIQDIRGLYVLGEQKSLFESFVLYLGNYRADFQYEEGELFVKISVIDRSYSHLTIEIGSEKFSPDDVQNRTRKLPKGSGVLRKGLMNPLGKRLSMLMLICGLVFGAGYVVYNFDGISQFIGALKGIHMPKQLYDEKKIEDFVRKYNQADIPDASHTYKQTQKEIYESLEKGSSDEIEDFKLVNNVSTADTKKLQLLKTYMEVALHIKVHNELFLFEGRGTKGVNMGTTKIGLHTSMMHVSFFEALNTFVHEISHNRNMDHGSEFIHTNSALYGAILEKYNKLIGEMAAGKTDLTEEELFLVQASHYRDSLIDNTNIHPQTP